MNLTGSRSAAVSISKNSRGSKLEVEATIEGSVASLAQCRDWNRAFELFEDPCEPTYANAFRLYEIYAQGAAFAPLEESIGIGARGGE